MPPHYHLQNTVSLLKNPFPPSIWTASFWGYFRRIFTLGFQMPSPRLRPGRRLQLLLLQTVPRCGDCGARGPVQDPSFRKVSFFEELCESLMNVINSSIQWPVHRRNIQDGKFFKLQPRRFDFWPKYCDQKSRGGLWLCLWKVSACFNDQDCATHSMQQNNKLLLKQYYCLLVTGREIYTAPSTCWACCLAPTSSAGCQTSTGGRTPSWPPSSLSPSPAFSGMTNFWLRQELKEG